MAKPGMGRDTHHGRQHPIRSVGKLDEHDLANERQGNNRLQANDQTQVRNQRHRAPQVGGASGAGTKNTTASGTKSGGKS